jgi:tRNA G10  N-methylase Trm11
MDPMLSMIMSNMAAVKQGDLVFDPFVGTGILFDACSNDKK